MLIKAENRRQIYFALAILAFIGLNSRTLESITFPGNEQVYRANYPKLYSKFDDGTEVKRSISINLGGGNCEWTQAKDANQTAPLFSTLLTAYPGSGKRTAFMQFEGMTELLTVDDYNLSPNSQEKKYAFLKTSYPQHEGIWSWEDRMSQVVLLLRNPRWAFTSYQHLLHEINYSTDWQSSYDRAPFIYTAKPPIESWEVWRDLRVDNEIEWWRWHLDYWMEGGIMRDIFTHDYTTHEHFNRLLLSHDFQLSELQARQNRINLSEARYDPHCVDEIDSCTPVAVASFERIMDESVGPEEIGKFMNVIQDKPGINAIAEEARACVWRELIINRKGFVNTILDRDEEGPAENDYVLTEPQMKQVIDMLEFARAKYSSPEWAGHPLSAEVVFYLDGYIAENKEELAAM